MPGAMGPALKMLLENAPVDRILSVLRDRREAEEPDPAILDAVERLVDDEARKYLLDALDLQHPEVLQPVEDRCQRIWQMADGKGPTSLETVAGGRLYQEEWESFEDEPDRLCRSVWIWLNHRRVFEAAESFHNARRYRDHGRMYDAFAVDLEAPDATRAADIDIPALEARLQLALNLRTTCTVAAMDLPSTDTHAASVMLIIRAGGLQTSVSHFDHDGAHRTLYYRPPNEATLIWTPTEARMEVCSDSPPQRERIGSAFAEVVLGHDVSRKPVTWRRYDLSRFRESFHLPIPTVGGCTMTLSKVIEAEVRLGTWSRKLALKVSLDDDITEVADKYLGPQNLFRRSAHVSRIVIAVRYHRDGEDKARTLNLSVSSGNRSNVQSDKDPDVRALGKALLQAWGILKPFRDIDAAEAQQMLPVLLALFDHPEETVGSDLLRDLGADVDKLMDAGLIERAGRQDIVLVEEDDAHSEATTGPSRSPGLATVTGPFGEELGHLPSGWIERYRIMREWLDQSVRDRLRSLVAGQSVQDLDKDLTLLGTEQVDGATVPVYLARSLTQVKTLRRLDLLLRSHHSVGPGVVLSASESPVRWLGPNVVINAGTLLGTDAEGPSVEQFKTAFRSGRLLANGGAEAQLIQGRNQTATLFIPGKRPYTIMGANQIVIFQRLVDAHKAGSGPARTRDLCDGMSYASPSQAFRDWKDILSVYVRKIGARGGYELAV